jgi:cation transport regulator
VPWTTDPQLMSAMLIGCPETRVLTQVKPVRALPSHTALRDLECRMPYALNQDLPPSVRRHLPPHAQDIFRSAFNHTWETYGAAEPGRIEEIAHRVARAALKRRYRKVGDSWVPLDPSFPQ